VEEFILKPTKQSTLIVLWYPLFENWPMTEINI